MDRGWCFCEIEWAMMVKNSKAIVDLGRDTGGNEMGFFALVSKGGKGVHGGYLGGGGRAMMVKNPKAIVDLGRDTAPARWGSLHWCVMRDKG
jgi:hypothetical protein